ncbi:hypothetical protein ACFOON_10445 [Novosphingobium piscinae]|uniref:Uncharacterized protein n=1 Tax=Novosphingobium piscinae TaxID=1507448 RepID=A0A7X1FZT0_9SPHN|nr:hypothetical protein [Novosphingobium piscinae]MBC2670013.1 hypothetical protein [Novosphingobium piscinae]
MTTLAVPPTPSASPRAEALLVQWRALHEAAGLVANLAGEPAAAAAPQADDGTESLGLANGWRLALIGRGLADTAAILEGGIRALLVARARGAEVRPAAQALWQEFLAARAALLALVPPH